MFIMTTGAGTGSDLFFLLFILPFILPVILKVLSGVMLAFSGGPAAGTAQMRPASAAAPASNAQAFEAAKREFPNQLLDLDNELTLAEEFGTDLNADELKAARSHLNKAFTNYSKSFGDVIDPAGANNVRQARQTIETHLAKATRHLGLADPNSPLHSEPAPEAPEATDAAPTAQAAPKANSIEDELYRRFGVERGAQADAPLNAARPAPTARRQSSVMFTPFGLMIGF